MAITVTKTVTGLTILNNADKIVSEVEVTTKSVDDSNPSTLTIEGTDNSDCTDCSRYVVICISSPLPIAPNSGTPATSVANLTHLVQ